MIVDGLKYNIEEILLIARLSELKYGKNEGEKIIKEIT